MGGEDKGIKKHILNVKETLRNRPDTVHWKKVTHTETGLIMYTGTTMTHTDFRPDTVHWNYHDTHWLQA